MSKTGIVIVGAGPCGIGAAWTLRHEFPDRPFLVVDASHQPGGCAGSEMTDEGFTFDYGGHVLFPHQKYQEFAEVLEALVIDWCESCPVRGVYLHGRLVPFPVQRNIHRLPISQSLPILADLFLVRLLQRLRGHQVQPKEDVEETLAEYLHISFGRQLTKRIMEPLNLKMWTLPPRQLSSVWVRDRSGSHSRNIPQVSFSRLMKHTLFQADDPGWSRTTTVKYPASGGTGSIWRKAFERMGAVDFRFGSRVSEIDTFDKAVVLSDGSRHGYSHLISTMPLDILLSLCKDRPDLQKLSCELLKSSALLLGFGVKGVVPRKYEGVHTFQCPERDIPFWRVTIPSNVSPGNVPCSDQHYSLLCEISCAPKQDQTIDECCRRSVLEAMQTMGLISNDSSIVSIFEKSLTHGYPLPFLGRDALLTRVQRELLSLGILSRGRFGGWRYEVSNQDHAFMQGVEAVRFVMTGEPESTYPQPSSVN
jgi:protoporphyrinogen oxidase